MSAQALRSELASQSKLAWASLRASLSLWVRQSGLLSPYGSASMSVYPCPAQASLWAWGESLSGAGLALGVSSLGLWSPVSSVGTISGVGGDSDSFPGGVASEPPTSTSGTSRIDSGADDVPQAVTMNTAGNNANKIAIRRRRTTLSIGADECILILSPADVLRIYHMTSTLSAQSWASLRHTTGSLNGPRRTTKSGIVLTGAPVGKASRVLE